MADLFHNVEELEEEVEALLEEIVQEVLLQELILMIIHHVEALRDLDQTNNEVVHQGLIEVGLRGRINREVDPQGKISQEVGLPDRTNKEVDLQDLTNKEVALQGQISRGEVVVPHVITTNKGVGPLQVKKVVEMKAPLSIEMSEEALEVREVSIKANK